MRYGNSLREAQIEFRKIHGLPHSKIYMDMAANEAYFTHEDWTENQKREYVRELTKDLPRADRDALRGLGKEPARQEGENEAN